MDGMQSTPGNDANGWTLRELVNSRVSMPNKPAFQLVVSCRTRDGDLVWTQPRVDDMLADLALGCARRVARVAERLTHFEMVTEVGPARSSTGSPRSIDIAALALATG